MAILITGGAGYIGSITAAQLRQAGESLVILDNLSRGNRAALPPDVPFYEGHIGDTALIARILREHPIEACIHLAAYAYVGESVQQPTLYYENNVIQSLRLLEALHQGGVRVMVFSSSCATYGEPQHLPITESHPQNPQNPYGWSKLFLEKTLQSYDLAYGWRHVVLRFFNVAGAAGVLGEDHRPETHLIPNVLRAARGDLAHIAVMGSDYPTPDGTAIRDYIDVRDIAAAHLLALRYLRAGQGSRQLNLGNNQGYSVMEVIQAVQQVTGLAVPYQMQARRPGDPSRLVADASQAAAILGWRVQHPDLHSMIGEAWAWMQAHPQGYV